MLASIVILFYFFFSIVIFKDNRKVTYQIIFR